MACQIVPYRVEARRVECKTAGDWLLLGLLRRCDILRTAKINTALIHPSKYLHSCVRQTPLDRYRQNVRPRPSPPPPLNPSRNLINPTNPQPPAPTLLRPQPSSKQIRKCLCSRRRRRTPFLRRRRRMSPATQHGLLFPSLRSKNLLQSHVRPYDLANRQARHEHAAEL